jgi:hypothetical protein
MVKSGRILIKAMAQKKVSFANDDDEMKNLHETVTFHNLQKVVYNAAF